MRFSSFLLVIVAFHFEVLAQVKEVSSLELSIDGEQYSYSSIALAEDGIVLYRQLEIKHSNLLELVHVDTALTITWRGMLTIKNHSKYEGVKFSNHHIWVLFRNEKAPNDYQVYDIDAKDGRYKMINIDERNPFIPLTFTVGKDFFVIGGTQSRRSVFLHHSLLTHKSQFLLGLAGRESQIDQVGLDESDNIEIVLTTKNHRRNDLALITFNPEGELISELPIKSETHNLTSARLIHPSENKRLLFGTYVKHKGKAQGIFSATISSENETDLKYYDFSRLKHFYQSSGQTNLMAKQSHKLSRQADPKSMFYLQQPWSVKKHYLLIANSFIPIYSQPIELYSRSSIAAPAKLDSLRALNQMGILSAFKLIKTLVLHFDSQGNLIADDSFPLESTSFQLENVITPFIAPVGTDFFFLRGNRIVLQKQEEGKPIVGESLKPPLSGATTSLDKKIRLTELHRWYNDYLLCAGLVISTTKDIYIPKSTFQFSVRKLKVSH